MARLVWILDADSVPEPAALEKLLSLYGGWSRSQQNRPDLSRACLAPSRMAFRSMVASSRHTGVSLSLRYRIRAITLRHHDLGWSMYRLAAVRKVGLPNPDYFIDRDDLAYTYSMMKAGYQGFIHQGAEIRQHVSLFSLSKRVESRTTKLDILRAAAPALLLHTS